MDSIPVFVADSVLVSVSGDEEKKLHNMPESKRAPLSRKGKKGRSEAANTLKPGLLAFESQQLSPLTPTRMGAAPQGGSGSTIVFFFGIILLVAGASVAALRYAGPDAWDPPRARAAATEANAHPVMPSAALSTSTMSMLPEPTPIPSPAATTTLTAASLVTTTTTPSSTGPAPVAYRAPRRQFAKHRAPSNGAPAAAPAVPDNPY